MHVAVEGMDAVGKTTVASELARHLGFRYYSKSLHAMNDPSGVYDSFVTIRDLLCPSQTQSSFGFRGSFLLDRVMGKDISSDRYLASNYWAHTRGKHFDELNTLIELTGEPDLTVILYADPAIIRERMVRRDPADKDLCKLPFIHEAYEMMKEFTLQAGLNCIWLDTSDLSIPEVVEELSVFLREGSLANGERLRSPHLKCYTAQGMRYTLLDDKVLKQCECGDEILRIPEGVRELRPFLLLNCANVKEVYLPASLQKLTALSFAGMDSLCRITVSPRNTHFTSVEGVLFTADRRQLIKYPAAKADREFSIPSAAIIGNLAFQGASRLDSLYIGPSVEWVGFGAFLDCASLRQIVFAGPVKQIGQCAFLKTGFQLDIQFLAEGRYCVHHGCVIDREKRGIYFVLPCIEEIPVIEGVEQLGPWALAFYPHRTQMRIRCPIQRVGPYAFSDSMLCSVSFPATIQEIDDGVFTGCTGLHTVELPVLMPPALNPLSFEGHFLRRLEVPASTLPQYLQQTRWKQLESVLEAR